MVLLLLLLLLFVVAVVLVVAAAADVVVRHSSINASMGDPYKLENSLLSLNEPGFLKL